MTEGYVTFVDDNPVYSELTNILIESVTQFSSKQIEVFSINCDFKHSSDRVINHRINVKEKNFGSICYSKLFASLNSSFDYGVQLDGDFIITEDMDKLFENKNIIKTTPLGSLHPLDPNNQHSVMSHLGVTEKSQPYVHATYFFSKDCKPFIEECYNLSQIYLSNGNHPPNFDETILNVMLWKYGSNQWLDCYDPYFDFFLNHNTKESHGYGWMDTVNFYSCHGIKDPGHARQVLDMLISQKS